MFKFILILSIVTTIIAFVGGISCRRYLTFEMNLLFVYTGFAVAFECTSAYLGIHHINNLWLLHTFTIIEYAFVIAVFSCWQQSILLRKMLMLSIPLFALLGLISMFMLEDLHQFNNYTQSVGHLFITLVSAYTLYKIGLGSGKYVFTKPQFWIASGSLLYFGSTLILFSLSNSIMMFPISVVQKLFMINGIAYSVSNLLYVGGFRCLLPAQRLPGR